MAIKNKTVLSISLHKIACFLIFVVWISVLEAQSGFFPAFADLSDSRGTEVKGSRDWGKGIISATVELNLVSAGLRLPSGRIRAEEILEEDYFRLIRPYLLSLQADSFSTINDLIRRGEIQLEEFNRIEKEIQKVPPSFTAGLSSITASYTLSLGRINAFLSGRQTLNRSGSIPPRPFIPSPVTDYTGIIIIADTSLPIHGRNTTALVIPCLFPKIWDTEMNLICDTNMAVYTPLESIFRPTPSGLDPCLAEIVGQTPLRIIARGVYGINPTDPVIDREDALLILSSENNRRLLSENRIVLIVNNSVLASSFESR